MSGTVLPLRPYQAVGLAAVEACHARGVTRPVLLWATGGGKTVAFAHMAERAAKLGRRTLILAHTKELVEQAYGTVTTVAPGLSAGIEMAARRAGDATVVVGSVQTVRRRLGAFARDAFGLVVVDECHRVMARSYIDILDHLGCLDDGGTPTVGVTATLVRGDGVGLGGVWQEIAHEMSMRDLINTIDPRTGRGYLVTPRGISAPIDSLDLSGVRFVGGEAVDADVEEALLAADFADKVALAYREYCADRSGLVFTPTVRTAHLAADALVAAGFKTEAVWGEQDPGARRDVVAAFRAGETQVLTNCMALCLDAETEILTDRGWTSHDEMTPQHRVANWDSGRVFFKEPYEIVVRDRGADEDMYVLGTVRRSIRVTSRHRMLYRTSRTGPYRKAPVDELAGRLVALPTSGVAEPEVPVDLSADECMLIGFWLGDGSANHPNRGGVEYTMSQSTAHPHIIGWVDDLLGRLGINCRRHDKSHYPTPHVRWSLPRGTGGKSQKRKGVQRVEAHLAKGGSDLLWNLDEAQFDALLTGLWYADGNHGQAAAGRPGSFWVWACSLGFLEKIQAIASVRGWTCSLREDREPGNERQRQLYRLSFHQRPEHRMGGRDPRYRIQRDTALWRPEKVWCVRTETCNIITRRHGSVTVMGNTEGFDAPRASAGMLARPVGHPGLLVQIVGRIVRTFPGKVDAILVDLMNSTRRHKLAQLADLSLGEKPGQDKDAGPAEVAPQEQGRQRFLGQVGEAVDLFEASRSVWLRTDGGHWFVPAGEGQVFLREWPTRNGWSVGWMPRSGEPVPLGRAPTLARARQLGEEHAARADRAAGRRPSTTGRDAAWRGREPSPNQLGTAAKMRVEVPPGATAGEVSDLISARVAGKVDRYFARRGA